MEFSNWRQVYVDHVLGRGKVHAMLWHLFNDMMTETPEGDPWVGTLKNERDTHGYTLETYMGLYEACKKKGWV